MTHPPSDHAGAVPLSVGASHPDRPSRLWDVFFFSAALLTIFLLRPAFLTDWDSFDYTDEAIRGRPSALALGRIYFLGIHALAWRIAHPIFGVQPEDAWLVFRGVTMVLGGLAAVAVFRAVFGLTRSSRAAILGGLFWLTAPQAMLYGGGVMTETPTMLFFALSIALTESAVRSARPAGGLLAALGGGAAFAVATNMREPLICFGLYYAGRTLLAPSRTWRRRLALAGLVVAGFAATWAVAVGLTAWRMGGLDPFRQTFDNWVRMMAEERSEYPNNPLKNAVVVGLFAGTVSAIGVFWLIPSAVLAAILWRRGRGSADRPAGGSAHWSALGWLLAGDGVYLVSLLSNHDATVNPRFAMPLMLPVLALVAAAVAEAVRLGLARWLRAYLAFGLAAIVLVAIGQTWNLTLWLPRRPGLELETWTLLTIVAVASVALTVRAGRAAAAAGRFVAIATMTVLLGLFVIVAGWPWLDRHYLEDSRWKRYYYDRITAAGALPDNAMLIPGPGTPVVQYIVKMGIRPGWILGYSHDHDAVVRKVAATPGWVVIPSGWAWPDGRDKHGGEGPQRKAHLVELVATYHQTGQAVFIYGGDSRWGPGDYRRIEWPQVQRLQETYDIEQTTGPGQMCRVLASQPQPGSTFYPLGDRRAKLAGEREVEPLTVPSRSP